MQSDIPKMNFLFSSPEGECELLGIFGVFIQVLLGAGCFSSLLGKTYLVKRCLEKNKRTFKVWIMDTSKQGCSAGLLHVLNVYLSSSTKDVDACVWYFLNFIIDTLLGMVLCYFILHGLEHCLKKSPTFAFKSGYYGENTDVGMWAYQMFVWMLIILFVKIIIWITMKLLQSPLGFIGEKILYPVSFNPDFELVMVMIVIPVITNSIYFWITDNYLKNTKKKVEIESEFELLPEKSRYFYN